MLTKENYKKDTYYKDDVYGRIMKVIGWSDPMTIGRMDFMGSPKVVMVGCKEVRNWNAKYLVEATDEDIRLYHEEELNTCDFNDSSITIKPDGVVLISYHDDCVYLEADDAKKMAELITAGHKRLEKK